MTRRLLTRHTHTHTRRVKIYDFVKYMRWHCFTTYYIYIQFNAISHPLRVHFHANICVSSCGLLWNSLELKSSGDIVRGELCITRDLQSSFVNWQSDRGRRVQSAEKSAKMENYKFKWPVLVRLRSHFDLGKEKRRPFTEHAAGQVKRI